MTSTSNITGATSDARPKMAPRDDSNQAKKAGTRKTNDLEQISLGQFLKETEDGNGVSGDVSGKSGDGEGDGGRKGSGAK